MTSGRYTAYHLYQDLSFPEASRAGAGPYTLPEYQCFHSQRGYLFQFDAMAQRNHFDAASTTCCDQPVDNFLNKPQFYPASRPMNPGDCAPRASAKGCRILEVSVENSYTPVCASSGAGVSRIRVLCPAHCPDLYVIRDGGTLSGAYGTFTSLGMEPGDVMVLDYLPDPALAAGWYNGCSGVRTITEEFCGELLRFVHACSRIGFTRRMRVRLLRGEWVHAAA